MRLLSYMLLVLGICLLGKAAYQQYRGITTMPAVTVREQLSGIVKSGKIDRGKIQMIFDSPWRFIGFLES